MPAAFSSSSDLPTDGDFGAGVDDAGNDVVVHVARLARQDFGERDALVLGLVGEHRPAHHVADRVDALDVGLEMRRRSRPARAPSRRRAPRARGLRCRAGGRSRPARHRLRASSPRRPAAGSIVALTPRSAFSTPRDLVARWNLKPCFSSMRWNCLATSPSMPGRMRSRNSTTVTSAPRRRQTEPSSSPMTPAPTTISFFGTSASASAPVEETMRLLVDLDAGQRRDVGAGGDDDVLGLDESRRRRRP